MIKTTLAKKRELVETARLAFKIQMQTINQQIKIESNLVNRCDLIAEKINRIQKYNQQINAIFYG